MAQKSKQKKIVLFRKRILFISLISFAMICSCVIFSINTSAKSSKEEYKYYKTYEIKAGDTLWSIANENYSSNYKNVNEYISEIKRTNHLLDNDLVAGEYLVISYYSSEIQ